MTPQNNDIRLSAPGLAEAKATPSGDVEGLAAVFGGEPDAYGDLIDRGAFAASLAQHKTAGTFPVMLWAHNPERVVGRWTDLRETDEGLAAKGRLNLKTDAGREAFEHIRAGDVSGLSIGYVARKTRQDGAWRVLTEVDVAEVSVVAIPANKRSRIAGVKAAQLASRADLRDLLHKSGLPRGAAEKLASGGWPALNGDTPDDHRIRQLAEKTQRLADLLKGA